MKNIITSLFTISFVLIGIIGFAQNKNSLLWKVSGNGLEKPSYIFGTIHMICEDDYFMSDKVVKALNESDELVTEINFGNIEEMMMIQGAMQTDISLKDRISEKQYNKLSTLLSDKLDVDIMLFDKASESSIASFITSKGFQCENFKMYELEFIQMAMASQKTLGGLESISEQMKIMEDHLNIDESIKMLEEMGTDADSNEEMISLYKEQNIDELLDLIKDSSYMNPKAYDEFVVNRNNNWVKKMPEIMKSRSVFFAVGAAHLASKDGILDLLRKAGYKVESLN